jgi:hypothetical protein
MEHSMKYILATLVASTLMTGGAWAHPRLTGEAVPSAGWSVLEGPTGAAPEVTGSLGRVWEGRDLQGRDLRSSTRGNAQFPERPAAAQNLGTTSGGPAF